jgi:hypothetical protein
MTMAMKLLHQVFLLLASLSMKQVQACVHSLSGRHDATHVAVIRADDTSADSPSSSPTGPNTPKFTPIKIG